MEAEAFASSPDPLRDGKGKNAAAVNGTPAPTEATRERKPAAALPTAPDAKAGLGEMKPVKAGTVAVEAADAKSLPAAPVEAIAPAGAPSRNAGKAQAGRAIRNKTERPMWPQPLR